MKLSRQLSSTVFGLLLAISASEIQAQVGNNNPTGPSGAFNSSVTTGCSYDPYTGNTTRAVTDIVVAGAVGEYGLSFTRTWNSRIGAWKNPYDWSIDQIQDIPYTDPIAYTVRFPDGRAETFTSTGAQGGYWPATAGLRQRFKPWDGTFAYLILADGGQVKFQVTRTYYYDGETGRWLYSFSFQAIALIDPYGLVTTFSDGPGGSLQITEPAGRWIQIYYGSTGEIDHITASDGREVHYTWQTQYFGVPSLPHDVLTGVVYFLDPSFTATYTYGSTRHGYVLLTTASDPMYPGPMKNILYGYKGSPNPDGSAQVDGQIQSEMNSVTMDYVTTLTVTGPTTRTETRADGQQRTFTYNSAGFLTDWTDFKGIHSSMTYDPVTKYVASITDERHNTTTFTHNPLTGAVTQIKHPATPTDTLPSSGYQGFVTYTYGSPLDPNNNDPSYPYYLYSITDEAGNATIFLRNGNKRVARINYPDGGFETFLYNSKGQVLTHQLKTGGVETFTYSTDGTWRLETYTSADNTSGTPTARYQYDARGRVLTITDVLGSGPGDATHATQYEYNDRGQVTVTTLPNDPVDHTRHTIVNEYNANKDGTLVSVTDQLLHKTSYTYDDYRRLRSTTTPLRFVGDSTSHTTSFSYDRTQGTGDDYSHTDANVTRVTLPSGNIATTLYDPNHRKTSVTRSAGSGIDAATTSFGYDDAGNLTTVLQPDEQLGQVNSGKSAVSVYDERNRQMSVKDPLDHYTTFTYDQYGRQKTVTSPNGQVITYDEYDSMNRYQKQTATQAPGPDAVTRYTYISTDLQVTMQDPRSNSYTSVYDVVGRKTQLTYPPAQSESLTLNEAYTYNVSGQLGTYKNRHGDVQTFSYDNLHRNMGFSWSANAPGVTFGYDAANRLTGIANSNATISRTYFNDNLLQTETETPTGGSANTVTYAWNADAMRQSIVYPSLKTYKYNYTGRDQLKQVQENVSPFNYQAEYTFDVNGAPVTRKVGTNETAFAVTTAASQPDGLGRYQHLEHRLTGVGATRTFDYTYDNVGNRGSIKRDIGMSSGTTETYGYDQAKQVVTGVEAGSAHTYGYDASGNRTTFDGGGTFVANNLNQQTTFNGQAVGYDGANGNVASSSVGGIGTTYGYDAQNRLTSVAIGIGQSTFKYDGLNRKISQTTIGTTTYNVWDGWNLIEERNASNGLLNTYIYGAGEIIERIVGGTATFYYQDGLGSTSHVSDAAGNLLEYYKYDSFGRATMYSPTGTIRVGGSTCDVRHLFTGQLWMPAIGLYDYRNRVFSPALTRFLQPDPIGFHGDPSNVYRYCGNNGVNLSDPLGTVPPWWTTGILDSTFAPYGAAMVVGGVVGFGAMVLMAYHETLSPYNPASGTWAPAHNPATYGGGAVREQIYAAPSDNPALEPDSLDLPPPDDSGEELEPPQAQDPMQEPSEPLPPPIALSLSQFSVNTAIDQAVGAVVNASATLGPGIGYVTVEDETGTHIVFAAAFGGPYGGYAPGSDGYNNHMDSLNAAAKLYLAFSGGGMPGEGFHPVPFRLR